MAFEVLPRPSNGCGITSRPLRLCHPLRHAPPLLIWERLRLHLNARNEMASAPGLGQFESSDSHLLDHLGGVDAQSRGVRAAGHGRIELPKSSQGRCGLTDAAGCSTCGVAQELVLASASSLAL